MGPLIALPLISMVGKMVGGASDVVEGATKNAAATTAIAQYETESINTEGKPVDFDSNGDAEFDVAPELNRIISPLNVIGILFPLLVMLLGRTTEELRLVKSKITSPIDSIEFKIPSLSRSRSILLIIPSLSVSSGQILTTISGDRYSLLLQAKIPFKI